MAAKTGAHASLLISLTTILYAFITTASFLIGLFGFPCRFFPVLFYPIFPSHAATRRTSSIITYPILPETRLATFRVTKARVVFPQPARVMHACAGVRGHTPPDLRGVRFRRYGHARAACVRYFLTLIYMIVGYIFRETIYSPSTRQRKRLITRASGRSACISTTDFRSRIFQPRHWECAFEAAMLSLPPTMIATLITDTLTPILPVTITITQRNTAHKNVPQLPAASGDWRHCLVT